MIRQRHRHIRTLDDLGNVVADYVQRETWILMSATGVWFLVETETVT